MLGENVWAKGKMCEFFGKMCENLSENVWTHLALTLIQALILSSVRALGQAMVKKSLKNWKSWKQSLTLDWS